MRILHISAGDIEGGAAKSAYRIHRALRSLTIDSHMLVGRKNSNDDSVYRLSRRLGSRIIFAGLRRLHNYRLSRHRPLRSHFSLTSGACSYSLRRAVANLAPDILNIHWIDTSIATLGEFADLQLPVVITLHDMWHFTGGCHYNGPCRKFEEACGCCPVINSRKLLDVSFRQIEIKRDALAKIDRLLVVGSSKWIASEAQRSSIFRGRRVISIPTPIDSSIYRPVDKEDARNSLGLPLHRPLVLFGAMNALADERKGYALLNKSLERFGPSEIEIVIIGGERSSSVGVHGHQIHNIGVVRDDKHMALLYAACDVAVIPSVQENLSNMIIESIAAGTPVVAFAIGGNPDIIEHAENGYLAKPYDCDDLYTGIRSYVRLSNSSISVGNRACFSERSVCDKYTKAYAEILKY